MTSVIPSNGPVSLSLEFNTKITLLTACMLPLLVALGFWQLDRAEQKRQRLASVAQRQSVPPLDYRESAWKPLKDFRRLALTGRFVPERTLLLDNRMRNGRVGYEVLMPFETSGGLFVLVNRGWVAAPDHRHRLPDVKTPAGPVEITASDYRSAGNPLVDNPPLTQQWPQVIVDSAGLDETLDQWALPPFTLRLERGSPGALVTDWQPVNMRPQKHTGYAVQWFAMAAALILWFVFANTNLAAVIASRWERRNEQ